MTEDFVRLSVGIENIEDILADIDQALAPAVGRASRQRRSVSQQSVAP